MSKERLEEIHHKYKDESFHFLEFTIATEDFLLLKEQAERVKDLEDINKGLIMEKEKEKESRQKHMNNATHQRKEKQRYREYYEQIKKSRDDLERSVALAIEALEESE